jgi:hypothetical protein
MASTLGYVAGLHGNMQEWVGVALAQQHPAKDDPQALVRMGNSLFFGLMVAVTGVYLFYEGFLIPVVLFIKFRFPERVGSSVLATPGDEEDFCSFPGS